MRIPAKVEVYESHRGAETIPAVDTLVLEPSFDEVSRREVVAVAYHSVGE